MRELLSRLRADTPSLSEDELRAAASSASGKPRALSRSKEPGGATLGRRSAGVAVAAALMVGSGLGFGLGSSVTPTGSAGTNLVGFGFVAAKGWTVTQADLASPGAARAIAANVRPHPDDRLGAVPRYTLESLPAHGVLIVATFTPRGDPERDFRFAARELPLSISSAERVPARESQQRRLTQYRIEASVGEYNLRAEVYLGSAQLLATAQAQLNRLVVASERVTIFTRRGVLFGSVDNGRAGEAVTIQAKDCGQRSFRVAAGAITDEGGGWSIPFGAGINTTVRAVWKNATSAPIAIREAPQVTLRKLTGRQFSVWLGGKKNFWRKRVLIERFNPRLGTWRRARSVVLTETHASSGFARTATSAKFRLSLPKGTLVRAVFPLSEARPCYVAGVSPAVRT